MPDRNSAHLWKDILIKIGSTTILKGSLHYARDDRFIDFKMNPGASSDTLQNVEEASENRNLYVNADSYESSRNVDFQHQPIRFVNADKNRKEWKFERLGV